MNKHTIRRGFTALGLTLGLMLTAGCGDDDEGIDEPLPEGETIPEVAVEAGNFTTLVALLESAGLVDALSGDGPFTVFAPSDDAFDAFEAENPGLLDSLTPEQAEAVLLYHVVDGEYRSASLSAGMTLETLLTPQTVEIGSNATLTVNGIDIVTADVEASNGVIHVIDGVLVPPGIVETALAAGSFTTLAALVQQAELAETLQGSGPFTVFAPTDEAFEAFEAANPGVLESLTAEQVSNVLRYHVVSGQVLSGDLTDGQEVETLEDSGETVTIGVGETVTVNDAQVVTADIRTFNGVIHVIDDVLVPTNP